MPLLLAIAEPGAAAVTWGVQAGVQRDAPQVRDVREFPSDGSWAPVSGAFVGWEPRGRWSARAETAFARRRFASPAFVTDMPVVADFLEAGLLALWRPGPATRRWALSLEAGPQVGFRLRARRRFRDVDQDVTGELREADLKAVVGLGAAHRRGPFLTVRFAFGMTDLDATNQQQIRARALVLLLGYRR